jgi:hypothetical protein
MRRAIAFQSQLLGADPKLAKILVGGASLNCISVAHKLHHVTRSEDFSLLGPAAIEGSALRVQEGNVKA